MTMLPLTYLHDHGALVLVKAICVVVPPVSTCRDGRVVRARVVAGALGEARVSIRALLYRDDVICTLIGSQLAVVVIDVA